MPRHKAKATNMLRPRPKQLLPKVTGYADNICADGIAYRVNPATIPAIGIEPDSKIQGLHRSTKYCATMQNMLRLRPRQARLKPCD